MVAGSTSETEKIESHRFRFGVWGDGLPRFDGRVLISDMRILGPPLTPASLAAFGTFRKLGWVVPLRNPSSYRETNDLSSKWP
jgi:hypothetical protein